MTENQEVQQEQQNQPVQTNPSLERFETAVARGELGLACDELINILKRIDDNYGGVQGIDFLVPKQLANDSEEIFRNFATRMAIAITNLFSNPNLRITDAGVVMFLTFQRWINTIFGASPFVNTDHIIATYNTNPEPNSLFDNLELPNDIEVIKKFAIMYLPESNVNLNLESLWDFSPLLCSALCFALLSPRFNGTEDAFFKRQNILKWFPAKLDNLANLDNLPSGIAHDVYMYCSYDVDANKHEIKRALNQVIRRSIEQKGWEDRDTSHIGKYDDKPVMVVLLEHFHSSHSIYRTHSQSLRSARRHFYLIGIGSAERTDDAAREVFDQFIEFPQGQVGLFEALNFVKQKCSEVGAAVFYMPSLGMQLLNIFASNTRLAPIQAFALGHPATSHSNFMDFVIVEDDYVGKAECFSEELIRLPQDGMPYVPSALMPENREYKFRENPEVVKIAITAATCKLNPYFMRALQEILRKAQVKIEFVFLCAQSIGLNHLQTTKFIKNYLGDSAKVYPELVYPAYLEVLKDCDMVVNPFPFGNTNGIIDMVACGLVGVCKTGDEVHEHIDEALFRRLGLPDWLITQNAEDYINAVVRLAENHQERLDIRRNIVDNSKLDTLFNGNPEPLGDILLWKVKERFGEYF